MSITIAGTQWSVEAADRGIEAICEAEIWIGSEDLRWPGPRVGKLGHFRVLGPLTIV